MASKARGSKSSQPSEPGQKIPVWNWTGAIAAANVEPTTKLVCFAIARYLNDAGKGWRITVKQLMADTGLSNKTISTHTEKAEGAGLLAIERTLKTNGQRGTNFYKPRFPDIVELSREPAELPGDDGESRRAPPSVPGTRGAAKSSVPRTPRPRERRTPSPSVPRTRQQSFHQEGSFQKGSFQERGAQALPAPSPARQSDAEKAIDLYNRAADAHGFSKCVGRTTPRLVKLTRRLSEIGGLEGFEQALTAIPNDDFLMGRVVRDGQTPFRLNISYLLQTDGKMGDVLASLLDRASEIHKGGGGSLRPDWWREMAESARRMPSDWWARMIAKYANGTWPVAYLGPAPGDPGCLVPAEARTMLNLDEKYLTELVPETS